MYVCVSIVVQVYIRVVYIYIHTGVHISIIYVHMYAETYVSMYIYMQTCMHVYTDSILPFHSTNLSPVLLIYRDTCMNIPPKNGLIALWPSTNRAIPYFVVLQVVNCQLLRFLSTHILVQ